MWQLIRNPLIVNIIQKINVNIVRKADRVESRKSPMSILGGTSTLIQGKNVRELKVTTRRALRVDTPAMDFFLVRACQEYALLWVL